MEMETQLDENESEQVASAFRCCICLDLLYKPVVLACGHASCFWCVHKSMSALCESHCPLCRHPYLHFPTICQMLHALLLKMYPVTYRKRENQILEEEKMMGFFSPNCDDFCTSLAEEESGKINVQAQSSVTISQDNFPADISKSDTCVQHNSLRASSTAGGVENSLPQTSSSDISHQILIDDVLCAACKQLLFRPVVLNCGHVYCESCLNPADVPIKCQNCQCPHPRGFPKVYLDLDHFVEEHFREEYVARKSTVQLKPERQPNGSTKEGRNGVISLAPSGEGFLHWCADNSSKVHVGVGCDYCGMYPIIGDRYRCKDCKEAIGFDLCGDCYNTRSKLPGRFNQQHTSDHRFEIVKTSPLYNTILRLLRGQSENSTQRRDPASENGENIFPTLAEIVQENAENAVVVPLTPGTAEDHQDDETQPSM